jgi:hypothetical protein
MNAILSLQRLDSGLAEDSLAESTQSVCCIGSTASVRDCCNTQVE